MPTTEASLPPFIRVIAICLFRHNEQILVFEGFDEESGTHFYRPLGGGVDAGETSAEAITRELQEELAAEVTDLQLLGVLESLFRVHGRAGHEIVFVYDGEFLEKRMYAQQIVEGVEDDGSPFHATWRALDSFDQHHRLVPEGLLALITKGVSHSFGITQRTT